MRDVRVHRQMLAVGSVALVATVLLAVVPGLGFTYVSATTRVAMETSQAVIAGIVALLVHGRFRRSGSRLDLLLSVALGMSSMGNLFAVAVRGANEDQTTFSGFASWTSLGFSLVGALTYAVAAHLEDRSLPPGRRSARLPLGMVALASATLWTVMVSIASKLPRTVTGDLDEGGAGGFALEGTGAAYAMQALVLVLFVLAAVGFATRASRQPEDELLRAVGTGLVLAAVARLNFILYPSVHTTAVHTGEVARLAFYLVLLAGAVSEISAYWRDRTQVAVLDERRRIARDLHDGIVQELSFIRSQVSAFERQPPTAASIGFVTAAAEHALTESRRALEALSDDDAEALDRVIRTAVAEVADRAGLPVRFDLAPGIHLPPAVAEQVRRVAREAAVNAVRHASARSLHLSLRSTGGRVRLAVTDDGVGFDAEAAAPGFGLRGMRERASSAGGELIVARGPHGGTRVTLEVPEQRSVALDAEVSGEQGDQIDRMA